MMRETVFMNHDDSQVPWFLSLRIVVPAGLVLLAVVLGLYLALAPRGTITPTNSTDGNRDDDFLNEARLALARDHDEPTCRLAVRQINNHLARKPEEKAPPLEQAQQEQLRERFGLDPEELQEIEQGEYTTLDAQHLELCLLLRDIVTSREIDGVHPSGGKRIVRTPLERANAIFDWVVRHVRLQGQEDFLTPPSYVLRRGWGNARERALIFLALLRQLGLPEDRDKVVADNPEDLEHLLGCLLFFSDKEGKSHLWACGVLVPRQQDLYLFDPRLGLPLPGPGGKGVATLAAVRKDPTLLRQLDSKDHPYDITAEQARAADLYLAVPLSALAPRMQQLEELLTPRIQVRLAAHGFMDTRGTKGENEAEQAPSERAALQAAARKANLDREPLVRIYQPATTLLRDFLPLEKGGVDAGVMVGSQRVHKQDRFNFGLVPWKALPEMFISPGGFRPDTPLVTRLRGMFANQFYSPVMAPEGPRDRMLRGQILKAIPDLMKELERWPQVNRTPTEIQEMNEEVGRWLDRARDAYAIQARAKRPAEVAEANRTIEELWVKQSQVIQKITRDAVSGPRRVEVNYWLALCKHDLAAEEQARLDLLVQAGLAPEDKQYEQVRRAWKGTLHFWQEAEAEARRAEEWWDEAEAQSIRATIRRLRGEVLARLGRVQEARDAWGDLSEGLTPLEQVANLYRIRQLPSVPADDK
jgi:hypothetical protein